MAKLPKIQRDVFTVTPRHEGWAVEHEGEYFDQGGDRQEVLASAARRARASHEAGRPAQICIAGEGRFV